jgi:hypothetical protein
MGVFSRFRRASKETSRSSGEAPSEQAAADAVTAAPAPGAPAETEPERSEEESAAGEGAAIPKQQSAAEKAGSEAGEGART